MFQKESFRKELIMKICNKIKVKNYNIISLEKQQKYQHYRRKN